MFHELAFIVAALTQVEIATKLAQAIANEAGPQPAAVYVGTYPPSGAPTIPLPSGTLLGSLEATHPSDDASSFVRAMGGRDTYFFEIPENGADAEASYRRQIAGSGWTDMSLGKTSPWQNNSNGGFVVELSSVPETAMYCSADRSALISEGRPTSMPDVIVIGYERGPLAGMICSFTAMQERLAPPPPLPSLDAPEGMTMKRGDDDQFGMVSQSSAFITGPLSITAVGEHFAKKVVAAGWSANVPAKSATVYAQTFQRTYKGLNYQLVLTLAATAKPQTYNGEIRVRTANPAL
jgi:hypothetical protein